MIARTPGGGAGEPSMRPPGGDPVAVIPADGAPVSMAAM
jgi:hypothetical protein